MYLEGIEKIETQQITKRKKSLKIKKSKIKIKKNCGLKLQFCNFTILQRICGFSGNPRI